MSTAVDIAHLHGFLQRARAARFSVSPEDYLVAESFVKHRQDLSFRDIGLGLSAMLAVDRDSFQALVNIWNAPQGGKDAGKTGQGGSGSRVTHQPRWVIAAGFVAILAIFVSVILPVLLDETPDPIIYIDPKQEDISFKPTLQTGVNWQRAPVPAIEARDIEVRYLSDTVRNDSRVVAIAAALAAFGLLIAVLPLLTAGRRKSALAQQMHDALHQREVLAEAAEQDQVKLSVPYVVKYRPPFAEALAIDASAILARLFDGLPSEGIDAPVTVQHSIMAGGRFSPVYEMRRTARVLTIFVDVQKGDHAWLKSVNWLLDVWRRQGIQFIRYDFGFSPNRLRQEGDLSFQELDVVARRSVGGPLLILSEEIARPSHGRVSDWLPQLSAWPQIAWVDTNPIPSAERGAEKRHIERLERKGLTRFPFTGEGVVSAALYFASDGESEAIEFPPLAPVSQVEIALEKWALLSARARSELGSVASYSAAFSRVACRVARCALYRKIDAMGGT